MGCWISCGICIYGIIEFFIREYRSTTIMMGTVNALLLLGKHEVQRKLAALMHSKAFRNSA
jgi:hypothetical protein